MQFQLDIIQTLAIAVVVLIVGEFIRKRVKVLEHFCIPAPVIGGILFSIIALLGYTTQVFTFKFDDTLKNIFLITFFTTIGFTASLKLLKKGGAQVFIFLFLSMILVVIQNALGIGMAQLFGLHPYIGLAIGSTPLVGGPGTAAAFGPLLEQNGGASGAATVAMAAATFGLVVGSLTGGPIAKRLIDKHKLNKKEAKDESALSLADQIRSLNGDSLLSSAIIIVIAMGLGSIISKYFVSLGLTFPPYIGGMLAAAIIRNVYDLLNKELVLEEIEIIGNISLSFFLSMALMSLKLWELANLALPMFAILAVQVIIMALFAYFVVFKVMGKDYEAAVVASGTCGFGLGSTANAMANMDTLTSKYAKKAPRAYFVVPLVGSLFIDFFNAFAITFSINLFK
jgi:ESS family glutamate:Na+ symporter